jgi:hypothetical protein
MLGTPKAQRTVYVKIGGMLTMGNQQAKVSDICWLAGFYDGEGSFTFRRNTVKPRTTSYVFYYPSVRLVNTHKPTLEIVLGILDQIPVGHNVSWRYQDNKGWSPSWDIEIRGMKRLETFLPVISPYLKTKSENCKAIEAWIQLRKQHPISNQHIKFPPYTQQELDIIQEVYKRNGHHSLASQTKRFPGLRQPDGIVGSHMKV